MSQRWRIGQTATVPPVYYTKPQEDVVLETTMTALIVAGGAFSAPQSLLERVDTDDDVTLADAPTLSGTNNAVLNQRIRNLEAGVTYRLTLSALTSGNRRAVTALIVCEE